MTTDQAVGGVATAADPARPADDPRDEPASFRDRLLEGLATSIEERGYRETKIADIVRHARTSRRTFYAEFSSKDECFVALLGATNDRLRAQITDAVDPTAPWERQVRQAVEAYVESVASEPAITVSWIRELPALGTLGRQVQRDAMGSLTDMLFLLADNDEFRRAGTRPVSRPIALILLGGLRELTATIVEDGGDIRDLTEVGIQAATALLGPGDD
jgi:AcrR family transcriptional regulator